MPKINEYGLNQLLQGEITQYLQYLQYLFKMFNIKNITKKIIFKIIGQKNSIQS